MIDGNDLAGTLTFSKVIKPKVSFDKISANEYVACYDSNFLHPQGPSNSFTWPKRKYDCWVPYMNVICTVRSPTTSTGQTHYLEKEGNGMISKLLN